MASPLSPSNRSPDSRRAPLGTQSAPQTGSDKAVAPKTILHSRGGDLSFEKAAIIKLSEKKVTIEKELAKLEDDMSEEGIQQKTLLVKEYGKVMFKIEDLQLIDQPPELFTDPNYHDYNLLNQSASPEKKDITSAKSSDKIDASELLSQMQQTIKEKLSDYKKDKKESHLEDVITLFSKMEQAQILGREKTFNLKSAYVKETLGVQMPEAHKINIMKAICQFRSHEIPPLQVMHSGIHPSDALLKAHQAIEEKKIDCISKLFFIGRTNKAELTELRKNERIALTKPTDLSYVKASGSNHSAKEVELATKWTSMMREEINQLVKAYDSEVTGLTDQETDLLIDQSEIIIRDDKELQFFIGPDSTFKLVLSNINNEIKKLQD